MDKKIKRRTFLLASLAVIGGFSMNLLNRQKQFASPNFRDGKFHNIHHTPMQTEGTNFFSMMKEYLFGGSEYIRPKKPLPYLQTDLNFPLMDNAMVWFGHSAYYIQYDGKKILVDPAFQVPYVGKPFAGTDTYSADDFPYLDFLVITHDHYDHLDKKMMKSLIHKVKHIICPLNIGELLYEWGYSPNIIIEMDWDENITIEGINIHCFTTRHSGGRNMLDQDERLWASFLFKFDNYTIYMGGDSGYDDYFTKIGKAFTPIDLAILENGQYDKDWKYIHMHPAETHQAMIDLKAKKLLPVHWGKYVIANHAWNEPIQELVKLQDNSYKLLTPMIGQKITLDGENKFTEWWNVI